MAQQLSIYLTNSDEQNLHDRAKQLAAKKRVTLRSLLIEALRRVVAEGEIDAAKIDRDVEAAKRQKALYQEMLRTTSKTEVK